MGIEGSNTVPSFVKRSLAGELICGLWDNGLFRDFDLAKMQEIPGCKQLSRVGPETRPNGGSNGTSFGNQYICVGTEETFLGARESEISPVVKPN